MSTRSALLIPLLSLLAACAGLGSGERVEVYRDPGFDASTWRAFTWRERSYQELTLDSNPRLERVVREATSRALVAKGYREVPASEADFAVAYGAVVSVDYRTDPRTGDTLPGSAPGTVPAYTKREGSLSLQVTDASERTVWIGSTRGTAIGPPPEGREEAVHEAVARILSRFPDAAP